MPAPRGNPALAASAPVFAALGEETRLRLVSRLASGEVLSITQLAGGSPLTRQAITKHLHVLAGAGLVRGIRSGREQLWQLDPRPLAAAQRSLVVIERQWDAALARLKAAIEKEA